MTPDLGLAEWVTAAGGSLVALELSGALIKVLWSTCSQRGIRSAEIVQGMAEALPFPDDSFDLMLSVAVLYRAIEEMERVTKPGVP